MERIGVLIVDDEESVRHALTDLISSDPSMDVVGTASDADGAIAAASEVHPDVALVDVKMPGGGGARATREIRISSPQTRVVALSAYEDRRTVLEMLRAGVVGYIVKGTPAEEILYTIRRSVQGQGSLSVEVTADVIHELALLLERSETLTRDLQELDRTKSEVIQILSHELFTPITAIQGFALMVSERGADLSAEEIRSLAGGVQRASERIRRLVGNLGASARLDREGVEAATRPVTAGDLLVRVSGEFEQEGHRLKLPGGEDLLGIRIWADAELATRAVVAVVENALDLSPPESEVEVNLRRTGPELELTVSDRGPGVPEEMRDLVFDAFTQSDSSTTRTHQGLGIGLYLARRIMHAHGGEIGYEPRPGGGSILSLSFPALDPAQTEER